MFRSNIFYAILITLALQTKANNDKYKLEFVQIIYRHGERAAIDIYPSDPNTPSNFEANWPLGLGTITLKGRKQHYSLGKLFRKMYEGFFSTKPTEVEAFSADYDRCLISAEANFASFFAPSKSWQFDDVFVWQPIPVTSIPVILDKYLGGDGDLCPKFQTEINRILNTTESLAFIAKHKKLFDFLSEKSGLPILSYIQALNLYDTLNMEKLYNLQLPDWFLEVWDELEEVANSANSYIYNSTTIQRLQAGPFLGLLQDAFDKKIKGELPKLKFRVYSSRDANIGSTLLALNKLPMKLIPDCATILFELYKGPEDNNFIRILYLNTTNDDKFNQTPHIINLNNCPEYCPYNQFIDLISPFSLVEYERECKILD